MGNGRRPKFSEKEDDRNFWEDGIRPTKNIMQPKTMVVALLRVTLFQSVFHNYHMCFSMDQFN